MNKKLVALSFGVLFALSTIASAAPIDELKAAVQKFKQPTGTYVVQLHIPFTHLDPMNTKSVIDLQTEPYRVKISTSAAMGTKEPTTSVTYEEMVNNNIKTYSLETLKKGDKTKSWVYTLDQVKPGETIENSIRPDSFFGSVKDVTLLNNNGKQQKYKVIFDCEKLFSNFGVEHAIKQGTEDDQKSNADFEKEFEKLRKSGTLDGEAVVTEGKLSSFSADISKPVGAFENAIKKGVARKTHTGAIGNWILGMIMKTGKSTMNVDFLPLSGTVVIPAEVKNSAVPKPAATK